MPSQKRQKPLYVRGEFKLFAVPGRNHQIVWNQGEGKSERRLTSGTRNEREARIKLDNEYAKKYGGKQICPTCEQEIHQEGEHAMVLIANYKSTKPKGDAIHPRLDHVILYMQEKGKVEDRADVIDEKWATSFRTWMAARTDRQRSPGTIENSLIQLAAAFRMAGVKPGFETIPTTELSRTPQYRSDVATLASMFRYCLYPADARSEKETQRRRRERENLLRYLRAAVATWARPDSVFDISTAEERGQWHPLPKVLSLNPKGRRQTRKYRPTLPVPRQFVPHLNATDGFYIPIKSVDSAWESMATYLNLPKKGQGGPKLIRRSVSHIARPRIGVERWVQGQMFLGHHKASTSDLYALFDPNNLGLALKVTEDIIDEIETLCSGAFSHTLGTVVLLDARRKA